MSIELNLPEELEQELTAEAEGLELPLSEYIARLLAGVRKDHFLPKTGSELIAHWQREGIIGSRQDIADSQEHARQLREQVEQRARD